MTDARKLAKLLLDLDTLLCEQMTRDKRLEFARFLEGVARAALEAEAASAYARGLEDAAKVAERLGGDRFNLEAAVRANPRDKEGRVTAHIEAQHLRAKTIAAAIRALKEKT